MAETTAPPVNATVPPPAPSRLRNIAAEFAVPLLAIFTALLIGAVVIWISTGDVSAALNAYAGLLHGSVGTPKALAGTLVKATPYIFAGLAVALAFKCGLFNIGA